jgi:hypothetical protein
MRGSVYKRWVLLRSQDTEPLGRRPGVDEMARIAVAWGVS